MTVILLLATLVSFIVLRRFSSEQASDHGLQTAAPNETKESKTQPTLASSEVDRRIRAGIDRRQTDRRQRAA